MNNQIPKHFSTFCSLQNLKLIREFLSKNLGGHHIKESDQQMIVLAVDEICSNSIIHGNKENANDLIDVFLNFRPGEVIIEIIDKGLSFDFSSYQEQTIESLIQKREKGSMGLMLVKRIMDRIEYKREKDRNICRLIKKIDD